MKPILQPREALVLWCDPAEVLTPPARAAVLALLNADERARYERFLIPVAKDEFLAGRALMRRTLGALAAIAPAEVAFNFGPKGKPTSPGLPPGLSFNLTHTRGCVALALALAPAIGLDAEVIDEPRSRSGIAKRTFAPQEIAWMESLGEEEYARSFFRLWTLKESLVKAHGDGIALGLTRICFHPDTDPIACEIAGDIGEMSGDDYHFQSFAFTDAVMGGVTIAAGAGEIWTARVDRIRDFDLSE